MAQLSPVLFRATNSANVPISGAGLFVYETGTSTLATLYSDSALTIPRANPVVSVSTGYWAQFYTASGTTLDLQARTTDDVASALLWEALDVDSVGQEDIGTFSRDFGADGRLEAVGTGGAVRLEFGPPTGDDIGGAAIISGWAGTDLDSASWKGPLDITGNATVGGTLEVTGAATITGALTVTGLSPFYQKLSSGTCTAAASQAIALPSTYDRYVLMIENFSCSAADVISLVFAFDATPTYKTAAGDYEGDSKNIGGTTVSTTSNNTAIVIGTSSIIRWSSFDIGIYSNASTETIVSGGWRANLTGTGAGEVGFIEGATNAKSYGKATYVKVQVATGTMTFKYVLFGIPGL